MLKAIVDTLDSVNEQARVFYRAGTADEGLDGKFVLKVETVSGFSLENVEGLKSALGRERTRADRAEGKIKKFGDLDPDAARSAIDRVAELEAIDPKKEADKLAQAKIDAATKQLVDKHAADMASAGTRNEVLLGQVRSLLIDNVATVALAEHKGSVDLLLPHVQRHTRLKEVDGGKFLVEVIDKEGNPRIGDSKGTPMTVGQLVAEMRQSDTFGRAFEGTGQTGSGTPPNGGGGTTVAPAGVPKSWAEAKTPEEKAAFIKNQKASKG